MPTVASPLYAATDRYIDAVEKGQRTILDLVESSAARIHAVTPDQLTSLVSKLAPQQEDLDRGYALVVRAVTLQQTFSRELINAVVGRESAAASKPKRAA